MDVYIISQVQNLLTGSLPLFQIAINWSVSDFKRLDIGLNSFGIKISETVDVIYIMILFYKIDFAYVRPENRLD